MWITWVRVGRRPPGVSRRQAALLVAVVLLVAVGRPLWLRVWSPSARAAMASLRGVVIAIDPGHGGPDPGSVGGRGTREKDVVLAVALQVRDLLLAAGARPVLTRTGDYNLADRAIPGMGSARRGELAARAQLAAESGAVLFVSIHANEFGKGTPWQGAQVFWDPRGHPAGVRLARALQEALRAHTQTRRVARPIEQFVLARAPVPAATVEIGFLSNPKEEAMLTDPLYQHRLAEAIVAGIARFLQEVRPALAPGVPGAPGQGPVCDAPDCNGRHSLEAVICGTIGAKSARAQAFPPPEAIMPRKEAATR